MLRQDKNFAFKHVIDMVSRFHTLEQAVECKVYEQIEERKMCSFRSKNVTCK